MPAKPGYIFTDVRLPSGQSMHQQGRNELAADTGTPGVGNLKLLLSPDRHTVCLTGQLVKDTSKRMFPHPSPAPRGARAETHFCITAHGASDGDAERARRSDAQSTAPAGTSVDPCRQLCLELRDGSQIILQESQLPCSVTVTLHNRPLTLTATQVGDEVRVELVEPKTGVRRCPGKVGDILSRPYCEQKWGFKSQGPPKAWHPFRILTLRDVELCRHTVGQIPR